MQGMNGWEEEDRELRRTRFRSPIPDEIPAASLLHPCKVAFLLKGVELPSGVSSFVCRRVYDTTNKRLWWLTHSSSPAAAYPSGTAYPYPGFPFGPAFCLPSTSFSGASAISGASTISGGGSGLCFPVGVPSQLLGPVGHYPRPYMIFQDGTLNGGVGNSRKSGRNGLDFNAGPGTSDVEGREERYNPISRQHPVASSQTSSEEQGGRMFQTTAPSKRKEPDRGWDIERFSYKQP